MDFKLKRTWSIDIVGSSRRRHGWHGGPHRRRSQGASGVQSRGGRGRQRRHRSRSLGAPPLRRMLLLVVARLLRAHLSNRGSSSSCSSASSSSSSSCSSAGASCVTRRASSARAARSASSARAARSAAAHPRRVLLRSRARPRHHLLQLAVEDLLELEHVRAQHRLALLARLEGPTQTRRHLSLSVWSSVAPGLWPLPWDLRRWAAPPE